MMSKQIEQNISNNINIYQIISTYNISTYIHISTFIIRITDWPMTMTISPAYTLVEIPAQGGPRKGDMPWSWCRCHWVNEWSESCWSKWNPVTYNQYIIIKIKIMIIISYIYILLILMYIILICVHTFLLVYSVYIYIYIIYTQPVVVLASFGFRKRAPSFVWTGYLEVTKGEKLEALSVLRQVPLISW